jgi:hypothetical protein
MFFLVSDFQIIKNVFKFAPKLIKQRLLNKIYGVGLFKNNFMIQSTEPVMEILIQAGIPQYFLDYVFEFYFFDREELRGPKVFSIDDLRFGFVIWLVTCGIALAAFAGELIVNGIKKGSNRLAELMYIKLIVMRLNITLR